MTPFKINKIPIEYVSEFKYLGYIIASNLCNSDDICQARNKFYSQFNCLLRKFHFPDTRVKLFIFKQYCFQIYGSELWFNNNRSLTSLRQFAIGYHKAIKTILRLSYHESNHYACQEAHLLTFENLLNKIRITTVLRLLSSPCEYVLKAFDFLSISSIALKEVYDKCQIDSLFENDRDAIIAKIQFIQNHERKMREYWD